MSQKTTQLLGVFNEFAFLFFNKRVDQENFQQGYTGNEQQFLFQCCMLNNQSMKKKNHNTFEWNSKDLAEHATLN